MNYYRYDQNNSPDDNYKTNLIKNNSKLSEYKTKITGSILGDGNTKNIKIAEPLKYLGNFWRTSNMPLINREVKIKIIIQII